MGGIFVRPSPSFKSGGLGGYTPTRSTPGFTPVMRTVCLYSAYMYVRRQ